MTLKFLISRALFDYQVWRLRRKLLRSSPALRLLDAQERAARKAHKPVRPIAAERSKELHAELAREVRHG